MHEAVVVIDEAQRIVALNPAAERLFACPSGQALGGSLARFIPDSARGAHAQQVRAFAAERAPQRTMAAGRRVPVQRADGSTRSVEIMLSRFEIAGTAAPRAYYAALMRDLGGEDELEAQVATLERRMRAVFELSPLAVWICEDERLAYANRAAARLFGMPTIDGLLGRTPFALLDAESHAALAREMARALGGQTPGAIVAARLLRADGDLREVEIAIAALPDHGRGTVQLVVNDVTERRREAADLERSRRALRELSASIVDAREEERRRLSRELHDELGQRLTALKIDLGNLGLPVGDERVSAMTAMIDDTLSSVRRIASDLRPLMLDDLGISAAIEWLARDASRRMGIPVQARLPLGEPAIDERVAVALYRMVQEALTNVARHAQARSVDIELRARGHELLLSVADDGVGITEQAPRERRFGFGLLGMRERARMLGGEVIIGQRRGGGTRLTVRLPMQPSALVPSA